MKYCINKYILQENVAKFTYVDIYETNDKELVFRYLTVLRTKYPYKCYRIVKEVNYV